MTRKPAPGTITIPVDLTTSVGRNLLSSALRANAVTAVPAADDGARPARVEDVKQGEYVKRKADAKKVYKRGRYLAHLRRYALIDCDDVNREVLVGKGTILFVGFTY